MDTWHPDDDMLGQSGEQTSPANGRAEVSACLSSRLGANDERTLAIPRQGPRSQRRCPSVRKHD